MKNLNTYLQRSNGRIFVNEKRGNPATPYKYHINMSMAGADKSFGDSTPIYAPKGNKLDEFEEVASIRGAPSRWSSSLKGRMPVAFKSILRKLAENKCAFDAQIHYGLCANPSSFHNYDSVLILENALISNYSTGELTALTPDERGLIEETISITAENIYPVFQTDLYETGENVTALGSIVAMTNGYYSNCDNCYTPCASYFGLRLPLEGSLAGNDITIIYSLDEGETWEETELPASASVLDNNIETYQIVSDGTFLYITFNEGGAEDGHLYIVPISEVIAGEIDSYIYQDLANTMTIYDTFLTETALWIVGTDGIVYKYDLALGTYSLQTNTTLFTNTWYDVHGLDDNNLLVGGATGRILSKVNGSSFKLNTLIYNSVAVTANIYNVIMKSKEEWLAATSDGELYATVNAGKTWKLIYDFNACISEIAFSSNNVGYLVLKQPAKVYRTIDGGFSWQELTDSYDTVPENAGFMGVITCEPNSFFAYGIEEVTVPDPCENTDFNADAPGIIITGARY